MPSYIADGPFPSFPSHVINANTGCCSFCLRSHEQIERAAKRGCDARPPGDQPAAVPLPANPYGGISVVMFQGRLRPDG